MKKILSIAILSTLALSSCQKAEPVEPKLDESLKPQLIEVSVNDLPGIYVKVY